MTTAQALIKKYDLKSHPEGGYFTDVWKSDINADLSKKEGYDGPRPAGSSIYYLIDKPAVLKWHRLISPEIYYWHSGGTFQLHFIDNNGKYFCSRMGDSTKDDRNIYQVVIEAHTWIAGEVLDDGDYVFFSNSVTPGFDYRDWELGELDKMIKENPQHQDNIERFFTSTDEIQTKQRKVEK